MPGTTDQTLFLTVPEVARELDMTPDGVYKLISRGKLKAVRRSERKTLVPRPVLGAYQRRLQGAQPVTVRPQSPSWPELAVAFEQEAGRSPTAWVAAWKKDEIDDTIENMQLTAHALSICIGQVSESAARAPDEGGLSKIS